MKNRASSIELLRIISMLMIIAIHLFTKTNILWEVSANKPTYYVFWFMYGLCMTGVNCYIIISGYFLSESRFRMDKLLSIYLQVIFYSAMIALFAQSCLKIELTSSWIRILMPITHREYWFATNYLALYCLAPFLNIFIKNVGKERFTQLLILLSVFLSIIPTFLHTTGWLEEGGAYGIVWFVFLYFVGAYVRKYGIKEIDLRKYIGIYLFAILLIPVSKMVIMGLGSVQSIIGQESVLKLSEIFYTFNSPLALVASAAMFICFFKININKKFLCDICNFWGKHTFGIYLIHNNRNISHYLWEYMNINYWCIERESVLSVVIILVMVFMTCTFIDVFRMMLFKLFRVDKFVKRVSVLFGERSVAWIEKKK